MFKFNSIFIAATLMIMTVPAVSAAEISKQEAETAATKAVAGEVLGFEKEIEDGVLEYEFDIKTSTGSVREVEVNAKTGKVRKTTKVEIEESGNGINRKTENKADLDAWKVAKVSKEDAEKTAVKHCGGGSLVQWESEIDNGRPEYEFLINSPKGKVVVEVNAVTGKVVGQHKYVEGNNI